MVEFNPLNISEELKKLYKDFILTSFPIKNESIKNKLEKAIDDEKMLWNGPYISVASKYKKGSNIKVFLEDRGMDKTIIDTIKIDKLFKHQEDAIFSIMNNNHTIVSTGTGSGKTESFLFPIIDHCIKNNNKGLKAIIVYPMNALANDQMLRLRTLLYQINSNLEKPIRIAKYTGETPNKSNDTELNKVPPQKCKLDNSIFGTIDIRGCPNNCDQLQLKAGIVNRKARYYCKNNQNYENDFELLTRDEIRIDPPDILITNYVQLEYLLLRWEDSELFKSSEFKFLVFDELHYYSGAKGSEVALLIRRLKSRIKKFSKKDLICIGTSATISSTDNAKKDISNFAGSLFGEDFSPESIILGEMDKNDFIGDYLPENIVSIPLKSPSEIAEMEDLEFKRYCHCFSNEKVEIDLINNRQAFLGSILGKNRIFKYVTDIVSMSPQSIENIQDELIQYIELSHLEKKDLEELIWSYLYAGSIAFDPIAFEEFENEYLIKPQVHMFFKTIGDSWPFGEIFVCLACGEIYSGEQETCVKCSGIVEEIVICRFCGEEFYRAIFDKNPLDKSIGAKTCIGLETTIDSNRLNYDVKDKYQVFQSFNEHNKFLKQKKCIDCGSLISKINSKCIFCGSNNLKEIFIQDKVHNCPSCGRSYGSSSAISGIYMSPNASSKVLFDLNYILLPEKERKMIVFSDSRQDASYMAGTIKDQHLDHLMRQVVSQVINKSEHRINYSDLEDNVIYEFQQMYPEMKEKEIKRSFLIEISSKRGSQRSTENLGLISIDYKMIHKINFTEISQLLEIPESYLIEFSTIFLDLIRHSGALKGLNNIKIGKAYPIGYVCEKKFEKVHNIRNILSHRNKIKSFVQKVFENKNVDLILESIFKLLKDNRFLIEENIGIYLNNTVSGYVVNTDKLIFQKPKKLFECDICGRLFSHNLNDICPEWLCNGKLSLKDLKNYYNSDHDFYLEFYTKIDPLRLEVAEDTGYIPIKERQERELAFRAGNIDLLVATPTLELGIDIGDLSCVGLMKSPPSPASYVQRVGRAGRSSKISMANTFMFQNSIDLYYFEKPHELISGNVIAPIVNIENSYILERHINSLILEELIVNHPNKPSFYIRMVKNFIDENCSHYLLQEFDDNINDIIKKIGITFEIRNIEEYISTTVFKFKERFIGSLDAFIDEKNFLKNITEDLHTEIMQNISSGNPDAQKINYQLMRRLTNISNRLIDLQKRELFAHLSQEGFIPRYTFPGSSVRIISQEGKEFSERQMPIALYELSPGMPIYINGKMNRVIGIPFAQEPEMTIKTDSFFICKSCGVYAKEKKFNLCPICNEIDSSKELKDCYKPSTVVIEEEGRPGSEGREPIYANSDVYLLENMDFDEDNLKKSIIGKVKLLEKKSILTIVSGIQNLNKNAPETFNFCETCGYYLGGDFSAEDNRKHKHMDILGRNFHEPNTVLKDFKLYHKFDTSVLIINLPFNEEDAIITFKNAIINASQRIVGADDGEIDGIIKEQNLILYDNVEGGAGYVNMIFDLFEKVLNDSINLILSCKCQKGCLKCLYSYRRRFEIPNIDKRKILTFSKKILYKKCLQKLDKYQKFLDSEEDSKKILNKFGIEKLSTYTKIISFEDESILRDLILSAKKSFIITPSIIDLEIDWEDKMRNSWSDILTSAKFNGNNELKVWLNNGDEEPFFVDKLKKWGIEVNFIDFGSKMGEEHTFILIQNEYEDNILILSETDLSHDINNGTNYCVFLNDDSLFESLDDYLR